ncbi:ipuC [Symbiodinium microadriaticum]|nr:ipuC [Symbiodinium microadriaticum]
MTDAVLIEGDGLPFDVRHATSSLPLVFVCEHASNRVPASLNNLGLSDEMRESHIAWDPGALDLATRLSDHFNAPLVAARFSRLVYDCNRPPEADSAMPALTEMGPVPGNEALTPAMRQARADALYHPFQAAVADMLGRRARPVLITVHSFTPVFAGVHRDVDIGLLHGPHRLLADALLQAITDRSDFDVRLNEPYGPDDGVLHTIEKHSRDDRGPHVMPHVMVEVKNNLLADQNSVDDVFGLLSAAIDRATLTFDKLKKQVSAGEVDTVLCCLVDMQGRLMGKRFHAQHFVDSAYEETHCCDYLLATDLEMATPDGYEATGWASGYGDYIMKPDLETLRPLPWLEGTVMCLSDILDHHDHQPVPHSPRAVLKAQVDRLQAAGFDGAFATELEFFLFEKGLDDLRRDGYRDLAPISGYNEDYHILQTGKEEHVMRPIRNHLFDAGIPVENSKGEAEAGQEELNITYADPLLCADHHSIAKHAVKEIAWQQGRAASFLAKYRHDRVGSATHIHQSLLKGGKPAFYDKKADHGMSDVMRCYVAGLIKYAPDVTCFLAPYINSYKRFQKGSFAPTSAAWSIDNRTAGFRLVGEGTEAVRIECRIGGADLNPYLAIAAQIAAGLAGIEEGLKLSAPLQGDAYEANDVPQIPSTLRDAIAALDGSAMLRKAMGDGVVGHYVRCARWEQEEFDRVVTDYEAQKGWAARPLAERVALVMAGVAKLGDDQDRMTRDLAHQMGRPVRYGGEFGGVEERAAYMASIAEDALAPLIIEDSAQFTRKIVREPQGLVFVIAPWNYPYLTAINTVAPALMAGNGVILKHAAQTPLAGEHMVEAFVAAGVPEEVFQTIFIDHQVTADLIGDGLFDVVNFTGSVAGGRAMERAAAGTFTQVATELGGKDPGYVMDDADLDAAVDTLIDGAMFNSGQCCCGIERIYVQESLFDAFVDKAVALVKDYKLGDPLDPETSIGPMANVRIATEARAQIAEALKDGATAHIAPFPADDGGVYLTPEILTDVSHDMRIMRDESFAPVVGIMKVADDEEAIRLMNDSDFGLTASLWTKDESRAEAIAARLETGTVYMNRCDYLDPALCWTGCKDTGWFRMELIGNWSYPTAIRFGAGRLSELAEACAVAGIKKPLLVTDKGLATMDITRQALGLLDEAGLGQGLFSDVDPNPTDQNAEAGVQTFREGGFDGVIAFGGGSALDLGKVIAFMAGQVRPLWDFEDVGDWWTRADADAIAPVIAVPTTAGTGSEVGRAGVITRSASHEKKIIFHPKMMPVQVICDPELTVGMPPALTAGTGLDAFAHCVEAFSSPHYHPFSQGIALEGMRLVKDFLPRAYADGSDIEARSHMMSAAAMGATAFQKGLGAIHAISHPIGALYGTHHGTTNAVCMPKVLQFNRSAIAERFEQAAGYLGIAGGFDGFCSFVDDTNASMDIPTSLTGLGVTNPDIDALTHATLADPCCKPRRPRSKEPIREQLIEAGLRLFAAEGYRAVSLRAVNEAVTKNSGAVHYHFGDRVGLIKAILETAFVVNDDEVQAITSLPAIQKDPVLQALARYFAPLIIVSAARSNGQDALALLSQLVQSNDPEVTALWQPLMEEDSLKAVDDLLAHMPGLHPAILKRRLTYAGLTIIHSLATDTGLKDTAFGDIDSLEGEAALLDLLYFVRGGITNPQSP